MKKLYRTFLFVFLFLFVVTFTSCGYEFKTKQYSVEVPVIACNEKVYMMNYAYEQLAREHADSYVLHNHYMQLAVENGYTDYIISVKIDGKTYKFVRKSKVNVGDSIPVTKVETYFGNELINAKYK